MEFYLLKNGERAGPFRIFHIVEMLRSDEVKTTDLAWCSTDDHWMPLRDIPALQGLVDDAASRQGEAVETSAHPADGRALAPVPEAAVAAVTAKAAAAEGAARPWMRYLARVLDCSIMFAIFAFAAVKLGLASPGVFTETKDPLTVAGVWLLASYTWVFIEAWFLARYGATLGKFLFNLRVLREDGSLPSYRQALRRSLTVWIRGYGLGIFPLREMLCIMSFIALVQDGKTPWDEQQSFRTVHAGMTRRRWITLLVVTISLLSLKSFVAYQIDPEFRKAMGEIRKDMEKSRKDGTGGQRDEAVSPVI